MKKMLLTLGVVLMLASLTTAGGKKTPVNLKVLKFKTIGETKQYMKGVAKGLGVKCVYCHDLNNFAADTNPPKRIARSMMEMVSGLNNDFFTWKDARQINCWTCHQGKKEPPLKK